MRKREREKERAQMEKKRKSRKEREKRRRRKERYNVHTVQPLVNLEKRENTISFELILEISITYSTRTLTYSTVQYSYL